jgi:DNA-binding CsgD family transcriptional regulator
MDLRKELTAPEADRLRELCNFSDDERKVFDMRIRNKSNVEISMALKLSVRTVNRRWKTALTKINKIMGAPRTF